MKSKLAIIVSLITLAILIGGLIATVILIRNRQETQTHAEGSATLTWTVTPASVSPGATTTVTISANSPSVAIDAAQLQIAFDSFDIVDVNKSTGKLAVSPSVQFPTTIQEPTFVGNELRFAYAASANLAEVKGNNITIATITLQAKTPGTARLTMVQAESGGTRLSGATSGNLLASSGFPAPLTIPVGDGTGSPFPTSPDTSPVPLTTPVLGGPSAGPLPTQSQQTIQTDKPTCSQLTVQPASGTTPLAVSLTGRGTGSSASGSAILATEFSFGEGQNQVIEKNYGALATETTSHTYQTPGSYQVFVRFRGSGGTWSDIPSSCTGQVTASAPQNLPQQSHYTCQGGACVAVAGAGGDECNPNQTNSCTLARKIDELPKSGKFEPIILTTFIGMLVLVAGVLALR